MKVVGCWQRSPCLGWSCSRTLPPNPEHRKHKCISALSPRGMRYVVNPPSFAPTRRWSPRGLPSLLEDLQEFIYGESSASDDPVKRSAFQVAVVPWKHHGSVVGDAHQHLVAATSPVVDKSQLPESAFDVSRCATRQPRAHRPTVPMGTAMCLSTVSRSSGRGRPRRWSDSR